MMKWTWRAADAIATATPGSVAIETGKATILMTPDAAEAVGAMMIAAAYVSRSMQTTVPEEKKSDA